MGEVDIAHELAETIESAELFLYPGDRRLFADKSLPDYDESAARLLKQRVLSFLDDIESQLSAGIRPLAARQPPRSKRSRGSVGAPTTGRMTRVWPSHQSIRTVEQMTFVHSG